MARLMKIILSKHLKVRIKERFFPSDYPEKIFKNPDKVYKDTVTGSFIAIKSLVYARKLRKISIAYILDGEDVKILTIHPEKGNEIKNRIKKGRYVKPKKV